MEYVSKILQVVLEAVLPFLVASLAGWFFAKMREIVAKLDAVDPELSSLLQEFAGIAVRAAEQVYGSGHGAEKKQYALDALKLSLCKYGISLDFSVLSAAIESAVYTQMTMWKEQRKMFAPEPETEVDNG